MNRLPQAPSAGMPSGLVRRCAGGIVLSMLPAIAPAADTAHAPPEARISVEGTASVDARPDLAIITLSVRRESDTARAALSENTAAMAAVIAAMKQAGVAERDLRTSGFAVAPRIVYPKRGEAAEPPRIAGYTVTNSLTVRVREVEKVGGIMDESVRLGVNEGGQIVFTNDKPEQYLRQARAAAMADAIDKARTLTKAAGVQMGRLIDISEHATGGPHPVPMMRSMAAEAAPANVPVEAGENTYSVTVNVSWAIQQ